MTDLFANLGVNISQEVGSVLGPSFLPCTLTQFEYGARTAGALSAGRARTPTNYACRGIISDYAEGRIDGTLIQVGDREVLILGNSLPSGVTPRPGDEVTIESRIYKATDLIRRDPAGATWRINARGRGGRG